MSESYIIQHIPTQSYYASKMIYLTSNKPNDAISIYYTKFTTQISFRSKEETRRLAMEILISNTQQPQCINEFWTLQRLLSIKQYQSEDEAKKAITNVLRNRYITVDCNLDEYIRVKSKLEFQILEIQQ